MNEKMAVKVEDVGIDLGWANALMEVCLDVSGGVHGFQNECAISCMDISYKYTIYFFLKRQLQL